MKTLAWIGAVAVVVGPLLAHFAVVPSLAGFGIFALGGLASLIAAIGGIVRVVRGRGLGAGGAVALVVGIVFVALASRGVGVPRINDFTTDMRSFTASDALPGRTGCRQPATGPVAQVGGGCGCTVMNTDAGDDSNTPSLTR